MRARMGEGKTGYINLLRLPEGRGVDGLYAFDWGGQRLLASSGNDQPEALFELSSRDIILFRGRPEAVSARNLLKCRVVDVFEAGSRVGIELDCCGNRLVAEVVGQAAEELGVRAGGEIYAAIKATAFKKLG